MNIPPNINPKASTPPTAPIVIAVLFDIPDVPSFGVLDGEGVPVVDGGILPEGFEVMAGAVGAT
jgi:hypothetical protein